MPSHGCINLSSNSSWNPKKHDFHKLLDRFIRTTLSGSTLSNGSQTLSRIINNEYELNWQSHCKLNQSTSTTNTRGTLFHLHIITKESQRSDFFHRTCKIVNRMDKQVNFTDTRGLKGRLLNCLWKFYSDHYDINNTCTWYPNCGCVSCKLILNNFSYWLEHSMGSLPYSNPY